MAANLVGKKRTHLAVFASGCIACGSLDAGSGELGSLHAVSTTSAPIIGGEDSPSTDNAIVQILGFADGKIVSMVFFTGTLVAPNLVMTARHGIAPVLQVEDLIDCRPGKTEVMFGPTRPLDELRVFVGAEFRAYTSNAAGAHRIKRAIVGPSNKFCDSDLAFLILEEPIRDVEPVSLRLSRPPSANEMVSTVGFGLVSTRYDIPKVRQRLDGLEITAYTPKDGAQTDLGEGPGRIVVDVRDRAPCSGDSGSPVLSANRAVIGIVSVAFSVNVDEVNILEPYASCLNTSFYGPAIYDNRDLVLEAFAQAGYPYVEESQGPDGAPIGASCEEGADCASNLCAVIGADRVCTSDCTHAPCPDGFACTSAGNAKWCLKQGNAAPSESGCSTSRSNSPGQTSHFAIALLAALTCILRRSKAW
ncbi:MAG: S1 family peptidase [Polyangiaceae bacterium]|nr:S1 family peptidase [Polyangiaceae bacterium]